MLKVVEGNLVREILEPRLIEQFSSTKGELAGTEWVKITARNEEGDIREVFMKKTEMLEKGMTKEALEDELPFAVDYSLGKSGRYYVTKFSVIKEK